MENIKVGDWVTSYSAGIWQVYRVLDNFYELRWNLKDEKKKSERKLVFSKRLFNNKWKRSFTSESCHNAFVDMLDKTSLKKVDEELSSDFKLRKAFEEYMPKEINLLASINFGITDTYSYERFVEEVNHLFTGKIKSGLIMDEILEIISKSKIQNYKGSRPQNARIQFVCQDHKIINEEFIFNSIRIFNF